MRKLLVALPLVVVLVAIGAIGAAAHGGGGKTTHQVTVPPEDRFTPYAVTIHAGDAVKWVNTDSDDHTVVSDDAFNNTDNRGTNQILAANGGTLKLRFKHPGTFVYYCRFHAHLDAFNQPVAPGPDGGIQDANGNFGTPMTGVITVLPRKGD